MGLIRYAEIQYNLRGAGFPKSQDNVPFPQREYRPVKFQYNVRTGQTSYLLAFGDDQNDLPISSIRKSLNATGSRPHPFAFHLILLFTDVLSRNAHIGTFLQTLLSLEKKLIFDETRVTFQSPDETKKQLQKLHSLFQDFVINQNYNKRDTATVKRIVQDLDRLKKLQDENQGSVPIDEYLHQRIEDSFLCLQDFCEDRCVRLESRTKRVQNLIDLVRRSFQGSTFRRLSISRHTISWPTVTASPANPLLMTRVKTVQP